MDKKCTTVLLAALPILRMLNAAVSLMRCVIHVQVCCLSCFATISCHLPNHLYPIFQAKVAGLNVLRLMNETAAVALNYGILRPLPKEETREVCFVDIGKTSTQCAVVSFTQV